MMYFKKKIDLITGSSILLLLFYFNACSGPQQSQWQGQTMGTTYHITVIGDQLSEALVSELKNEIDSALVEVNRQMSTYDPNSEISQFNQYNSTEPFKVSPEFFSVVKTALALHQSSQGAFDITVGPLVELWGFGAKGRRFRPPDDEQIKQLLSQTGSRFLHAVSDSLLVKDKPQLHIDLSAIAKGFGVDVAGKILNDREFSNYLVEIGGEVVSAGTNAEGENWRIGIDRPSIDTMPGSDLTEVLKISGQAVATSGDYRNYFEYDGKMYSHTINPKSGYPVEHKLASATVIAANCTQADGLATALMAMGVEKGMPLVERMQGVEALLIERLSEDEYKEHFSSGFKKFLVAQ